jgi:hypothetical protein
MVEETTQVDLSEAAVVRIDGCVWSGETALKGKDIAIDVPKDVVRLGAKRLYPAKRLSPFAKLKRRAQRACKARGPAWLGGYIIPRVALEDLLGELHGIRAEYEAEKAGFLAHYEEGLEELQEEAGEWWPKIAPHLLDKNAVADKLDLKAVVFQPAPVEMQTGSEASEASGLDAAIADIPTLVAEDVGNDALDFWTHTVAGAQTLRRQSLARLRKLREKAAGLSRIDTRLDAVVERVQRWEQVHAGTGPIEGEALASLEELLLRTADMDKFEAAQEEASVANDNARDAEKEPQLRHDDDDKHRVPGPPNPSLEVEREMGRAHGMFF